MLLMCRDLTDDVIRLADPQSDTGWQHRGDHLHRVQQYGKKNPLRFSSNGDQCGVTSVDSVQGRRILAASYDTSALLWERDNAVPKVTDHPISRGHFINSQLPLLVLQQNTFRTAVVSHVCLTYLPHLFVSPICLTCLSHLSVSADSNRSQQEGDGGEVQRSSSSGSDRQC